jgi:hypothetical protein
VQPSDVFLVARQSIQGLCNQEIETAGHRQLLHALEIRAQMGDDAEFMAHRASRRTVIGPDTWLGHGVIVKPEVTIGAGAVIASGAVVTKDVPPYMIMAGIPAQPLRPRFARGIADRLMALAWWDWSHERLRAALLDFRALKAEAFLEKYQG